MQLLSLTLKGFRYFPRGLGCAEINLDFERPADGAALVAIVGAYAKTTMDTWHWKERESVESRQTGASHCRRSS
jgi:hypothetical protein